MSKIGDHSTPSNNNDIIEDVHDSKSIPSIKPNKELDTAEEAKPNETQRARPRRSYGEIAEILNREGLEARLGCPSASEDNSNYN